MNGDRAHDEVVSDLTALQGRLRGVDPVPIVRNVDGVTVIDGELSVRATGTYPAREWRRFPEFNFAPQVFQLTLDDQIALLQGSIAERLDHDS